MGAMKASASLRAALACAATGLVFLLAGCGPRTIGYGVILWGEMTGPAATGAVVGIVKQADTDNTLIMAVPGERKPREYPAGRVRPFLRKADAAQFSSTYAASLHVWAFSQKLDPPPLPLRDQPRQEGRTVYRLKPGQLMKVVSRSAARETVKPYEDYWYEVVTEDGYAGFCFGHYLKVFETTEDPSVEAARIMSQDEVLDRLLGSTWRPDWFLDSIGNGAIDLSRFREDVGLFPMPTEKLFRLTAPQYSVDFKYDHIERAAAGTYVAVGTSLRITILGEDRISITYRYKDQEMGAIYVTVKDDVAEIITREQNRRQDVFSALAGRGAVLTSSAYGRIRLEDGMRFTWQGYERLVPVAIPRPAGARGRVDFAYHAARALAGEYDGVITFTFDPDSGSEGQAVSASFLYTLASGGVRFTSLGKESFAEPAAVRPGLSPLVIYFTQGPG
jgi:hypothetical protein